MDCREERFPTCKTQGINGFGSLRWCVIALQQLRLYHTDPSGNFSGWKGYAIGGWQRSQIADPVLGWAARQRSIASKWRWCFSGAILLRFCKLLPYQPSGVNNNTAMQIMRQDWKPGEILRGRGFQSANPGSKPAQLACVLVSQPSSNQVVKT